MYKYQLVFFLFSDAFQSKYLVILFLKWYNPNQRNIYCVCCIWGERSKAALETLGLQIQKDLNLNDLFASGLEGHRYEKLSATFWDYGPSCEQGATIASQDYCKDERKRGVFVVRYIGTHGDGNSHPVWQSLKTVVSPFFKRTATLCLDDTLILQSHQKDNATWEASSSQINA